MGGLLVAIVCAVVIAALVAVTVIFPRDKSAQPTKDPHAH
jgi:hypothetical protein